MNNRMSVAKQSLFISVLNWILLPLGILISVIVARAVGPEGKGVLALLAAAVGLFSSLGSFGLADSFIYYYKKKIYPFRQIVTVRLSTVIVFSLVVFLGIILFSEQFIKIFFQGLENYEINPLWIYLSFLSIPLSLMFGVFNLILIVDNQMGLYTVNKIGSKIASLVFISLLLFVLRFGITGILLSQLLVYVIPTVILWKWLKKNKVDIKWAFSKEAFQSLFRTGRRQYGVSLLSLIPKRIDFFLIGLFLTVKFNGYYAVAFGLMNLIYDIPKSTMWPLVGNLTCKDENEKGKAIAQVIRIMLPSMIIIALILGWSAYSLIYYLYGENFLESVSAFRFMVPAMIASAIIIPGNAYYNSIGQPGRIFPYLILLSMFHVVLDVILIPLIGIRGAAIVFSLRQIFIGVIYIFLLTSHTGIPAKQFLLFSREDAKMIYELIVHKTLIIRKA